MTRARFKALLKLTLLLVFIGLAIYVVCCTEMGRSFSPDRISRAIGSYDPLLTRLLYVLLYIVGTLLLLPGTLLSFIGALLFGVWEGTLYTWLGATIGATLAFWLAKALGRDLVEQLLGGKLQALDERLRGRGFVGLLVLRLVPLFPFNVINFGCGLTSLRTCDYLLATALGIVPGTFVYQYLFAKIGRRLLDEGFAWSDLADADVLLPLGVFVIFLVISGWFAKRLRGPVRGHEPRTQ